MKSLQWRTRSVTDTCGACISLPPEGTALTLRTVTVESGGCRGYAGYISLACDRGMSGSNTAVLIPECRDGQRYLAIVNHSPFWCRPFWGDCLHDLPDRVQELLIETEDGYVCWLPVCAEELKTVIRGGESGMELVVASNVDGMTSYREQLCFLCMEGKKPLELLRAVAETAAKLLGNGLRLREEKEYPKVFESLGWCSWDAFQIRVNHAGLVAKAEEFREKQVPVKFAIIDDMWADVPKLNAIPADASFPEMVDVMHHSPLRSFMGDPARFPNGIESAIADLKKNGIRDIGIWFPTTGYWAGFDTDGEEFRKYRDSLIFTETSIFVRGQAIAVIAPDREKAGAMFDDFCARVKDWGGDFVKIDNQGFHSHYRNIAPIGVSARAIQGAIDAATEKHFGGALINCMGMPSECMFNRTSAVSRCSDDFMPESHEWFTKNILQCAFNGLLQGQYYYNDWDMWWTDDGQAEKNSLCRAISGGPIYISDKLGRTNPEILKPLCLSDGRILRCDESATPTADCLITDPTKENRVFKIRNRVGENGILAAFYISDANTPIKGFTCPEDCGLSTGSYAWYEFFTQTAGILSAGEGVEIDLAGNDDFRLYTFVPLPDDGVAVMGRTDLFIGVKAASRDQNGILLVEAGPIGMVSAEPIRVFSATGEPLPADRRGVLTVVSIPDGETLVCLG